MRFIHIADMHFDMPFTFLDTQKDLGNVRRLEQRDVFKNMIKYIKEENIPFLFISGDLYEDGFIRESTIKYINNLFETIPLTKIFISPGNHDPFLVNSFYNTFSWNNNVHIFNSEIERVELEEVDIYGYGFSDFHCLNSGVENIRIKNKDKINILVVHGALDSSKTLDMQYNPINSNNLNKVGFDYVALGHIHKPMYENKNNFIYPGSMISFGFDELGEHGMLDIELIKNKINNIKINNEINNNKINNNKNNIKIKFIKLDNRIFEELKFNISEINSQEELIEKINELDLEENKNYKIILIGNKKVKINIKEIYKLISQKNILKIKDETKKEYDIEKIIKQNNLKSFFLKEILDKKNYTKYTKEEIERSIEIGLDCF